MIKNDHMAFQVSNMDASIRFYTEALGLKLLFRHVNEEVREDYAFLELDGGNRDHPAGRKRVNDFDDAPQLVETLVGPEPFRPREPFQHEMRHELGRNKVKICGGPLETTCLSPPL